MSKSILKEYTDFIGEDKKLKPFGKERVEVAVTRVGGASKGDRKLFMQMLKDKGFKLHKDKEGYGADIPVIVASSQLNDFNEILTKTDANVVNSFQVTKKFGVSEDLDEESVLENKEELNERTDNTLYIQYQDGILVPQIPYIKANSIKIKNWDYPKAQKVTKHITELVLYYNDKINSLCKDLEGYTKSVMEDCARDIEAYIKSENPKKK